MKKALVVCHLGRHYKKFGHYDIKVLQNMGYEVHFAANFKLEIDKVDDDSIILHQIDFERSPFSLKNIKAYFQLKKEFKKTNYDLIHCQSPVGGAITRLAARKIRKKGVKVIYTAHGFHFFKGAPKKYWLLFYPVEKYLSKYTDILITINKEDYNLAFTKFKKTKVEYVPGVGVDFQKFDIEISDKEKNEIRKSLNLKADDFIMVCVAEISKNKNQVWIVNDLKDLLKKYSNMHLLLAGDYQKAEDLKRIIEEYSLENQVHLLGFYNDIPKLLKISDLGVSASIREGLPLNIMEFMSSKLPMVVLNCRGMEDLLGSNSKFISTKENFSNMVEKFYKNDINYIDEINFCFENLKNFSRPKVEEKMKKIFSMK